MYIFLGTVYFNLLFLSFLYAQTEKKENFFTSYGVGARAIVLKSAYVSIADDYTATHWNPAGIAFLNQIQVGAMHSRLSLNRQLGFVSMVMPLDQNNKFGISWKGLLIDDIPARSINSTAPDYLFKNIEQVISLTYSRKIFSPVSIGVNLNYLNQSLNEIIAGGYGLDAGLMLLVNRKIKIGLVFYDCGSHLKWTTGHKDYFQRVGRVGISYQPTPTSLLAIAMEGENQLSAAVESRLTDQVYMRMGWQESILSLGMGLKLYFENIKLNFNYAVSNHKLTDELSHIFDISIMFCKSSKFESPVAIVRTNRLNVRSGPGVNYKKIALLYKGQELILLDKKSSWIKIRYADNRTGWINRNYVEVIS